MSYLPFMKMLRSGAQTSPAAWSVPRWAGAALLLSALAGAGCSRDLGPTDFEARLTINILPRASTLHNGFSPNPATCSRNTRVEWTNLDSVNHRIVSNGGFFDSGAIEPGQTYQLIFREAGNFSYHDAIPGSRLQGVLNVTF